MALPLVTTEAILEYLTAQRLGYEIFDEWPSDKFTVRTGIYIDHVKTAQRTPYALAVNYGGNIYTAEDEFMILLVTYQADTLRDAAVLAIQNIVANNVLLDGYHQRDFTQDEEWRNRAEYLTFTFTLSRIEFQ